MEPVNSVLLTPISTPDMSVVLHANNELATRQLHLFCTFLVTAPTPLPPQHVSLATQALNIASISLSTFTDHQLCTFLLSLQHCQVPYHHVVPRLVSILSTRARTTSPPALLCMLWCLATTGCLTSNHVIKIFQAVGTRRGG